MKQDFEIIRKPRGDRYRELLEWCARRSAWVGFIVSDPESLSDQGKALIQGAEARHAAKRAVTEWPGTVILEGTGTVTMYLMPAESNLDLILSAASDLYAWVNYDLPQDPFFLRDDHSALLTTTAHEEHAHLTLTPAEMEQLQRELPWIRPMLKPMDSKG